MPVQQQVTVEYLDRFEASLDAKFEKMRLIQVLMIEEACKRWKKKNGYEDL